MGEYAKHHGESIKIGTCEQMYYLRADQAQKVTAERGSVDPIRDAEHIRFRFPWPDEDHVQPGHHDVHDRGMRLHGVTAPAELAGEHSSIQFRTETHGYNVCLPCPESIAEQPQGFGPVEVLPGVRVHRNGFRGATFLAQQRLIGGQLVPILRCTCGMMWRLESLEDCAPVFDALEWEHKRYADSFVDQSARPAESTYSQVAERVRRGFDREYVASLGFDVGAELVRLPDSNGVPIRSI